MPPPNMLKKLLCLTASSSLASPVLAQNDSLEEIEVVGSRGSLASAMNKQRAADSLIGVVDSDSLGNFADINVAESLRRIAGIMVENDQGEGRYVSVRGLNADLNAMTINGVSAATPEDRRGIMLDGVPTDLLESMTIYKTLTPNLDADTIGGAIDLETISAFSRDERFFRLKLETSYNELSQDSSNPKMSATFSDRYSLDGGELGVALVISDQKRRIVTHNNENGGWSTTAPEVDYEMRFYDIERERQGIVLNFDYVSDRGNTFYAHMFQTQYTEREQRAKFETRDGIEDNTPLIVGDVFSYADSKADTEAKSRFEVREIESYQLGAELQLSDRSRLDVELFGSRAEQDDTDRFNVVFRTKKIKTPLLYDNSNAQKPVVSFADEFYDASNFELNTWEREFGLTTDRDSGVKFDYYFVLSDTTDLQFGSKYRRRAKQNDFNFCGYDPLGDVALIDAGEQGRLSFFNTRFGPTPSMAQAVSLGTNLGAGSYALSDGTSCPNTGSFFEVSGDEEEESIAADWATDEDVFAVYAMATTHTDRTTWVYGLRYEDTKTTYRGKLFDGDGFAGRSRFKNDFDFLAPSLNIKYEVGDDQLMRFGAFRSLVRPGFKESRAGATIDLEDNEIEGGNPELDATSAWNFDLSYEYYLDEETFLSGGFFYKSIENPIVEVETKDSLFRGRLYDEASTFQNASDSDIFGYEVSFQTALENGFVFVVNYTHADGNSGLPANSVNGQRSIPFFKQAEHSANVAIGYDRRAWDIRLAGNYRSNYLDEIGDAALDDRITDDHLQIDLTLRYQINDKLTLTAEAINLNDEPEYYYFGNSNRLSQYDEYGTTYGAGFRYRF